MKTIALIMLCLIVLESGCMNAEYNPQTGLVKYNRLGDMEASDIDIAIDPNSVLQVKVGSTKNTGFESVVKAINDAYKAGLAAR
jgi:hypothetical protein